MELTSVAACSFALGVALCIFTFSLPPEELRAAVVSRERGRASGQVAGQPAADGLPASAELVQVQVLFRHGARTRLSERYLMGNPGPPEEDEARGARAYQPVPADACSYEIQGPPLKLQNQPGSPALKPPERKRIYKALHEEGPLDATALAARSGRDIAQRDGQDGAGQEEYGDNGEGADLPSTCRRGQLTRAGYSQAVRLGQWIRAQYWGPAARDGSAREHLLTAPWAAGAVSSVAAPLVADIAAHSTHISRALLSLQGVLQGLLQAPDTEHAQPQQGGGAGHKLQPVPVAVAPEDQPLLIPDTEGCARFGQLARVEDAIAQVTFDSAGVEDERRVRSALSLPPLEAATAARPPTNWISWKRLLDAALTDDVEHPLSAPPAASVAGLGKPTDGGAANGTAASSQSTKEQLLLGALDEHLLDTVNKQATARVAAVMGPRCNGTGVCRELLQLGMGRLLYEVLSHAVEAATEALPTSAGASTHVPAGQRDGRLPALRLYSGHDTLLFPLLAALGHPLERWPYFSSHLVLELYRVPLVARSVDARSSDDAAPTARAASAATPAPHGGETRRAATAGKESSAVQEDSPAKGVARLARALLARAKPAAEAEQERDSAASSRRSVIRLGEAKSKEQVTEAQAAVEDGQAKPKQVERDDAQEGADEAAAIVPSAYDFRVGLLYNGQALFLDAPHEGRTQLPRLASLEAILAPYTIPRQEYVKACRETDGLTGLLEAALGKEAAATARWHFFETTYGAADSAAIAA